MREGDSHPDTLEGNSRGDARRHQPLPQILGVFAKGITAVGSGAELELAEGVCKERRMVGMKMVGEPREKRTHPCCTRGDVECGRPEGGPTSGGAD